jgi:O-methyltransferase domain/Dimerisation domain
MATHDDRADRDEVPPIAMLVQMLNGYELAQAIAVAAKLGVADLLHSGPRSSEDLAQATGTHAPTLYRLLRALASVGIFAEDQTQRFSLTPLGDALRSEAGGFVSAFASLLTEPWWWRSWDQLLYSVTTGQSGFDHLYGTDMWAYQAEHPEASVAFNAFVTAAGRTDAASLIAAYDFAGVTTLVDVGGGQGIYLSTILRAHPTMQGILFDLPHVVSGAPAVLAAAGVIDRCNIVAGDMFTTTLPLGGDAYLLGAVIHTFDDAQAAIVLRHCHQAMSAGGKLLLMEMVVPEGNVAHPSKFTDLRLLVLVGGRTRTAREFETLYAASGFTLTRIVPLEPTPWSIVEGVRA